MTLVPTECPLPPHRPALTFLQCLFDLCSAQNTVITLVVTNGICGLPEPTALMSPLPLLRPPIQSWLKPTIHSFSNLPPSVITMTLLMLFSPLYFLGLLKSHPSFKTQLKCPLCCMTPNCLQLCLHPTESGFLWSHLMAFCLVVNCLTLRTRLWAI